MRLRGPFAVLGRDAAVRLRPRGEQTTNTAAGAVAIRP